MFDELEKATKSRIKRRKAYGHVRASNQTFPDKNFTDVVPKEMLENKPDILVLQRDSVTLTNLSPGAPQEYARQQVMLASYNMVTVATNALAANPQLKHVVVMEAVPRFDGKEELNDYGNKMLHKAKQESNSSYKNMVTIGVHNLQCEGEYAEGLVASRYGDRSRGHNVDMVHMKGPSGMAAFTKSVARIFAGAGLCSLEEASKVARPGLDESNKSIKLRRSGDEGFQVQGRRSKTGRRSPRQQQQVPRFELPTNNQFGVLQGNA